MKGVTNPAQLPPNCVLCLTVTDPRIFLPGKRIKAVPEGESPSIASLPRLTNHSPIWQPEIRDQVTDSKQPDYQLAKAREAVLVPGSKASSNDIKNAAKVPVMLVQRPGNRDPTNKKLGFASGWDVIAPLGWGMPLWQCMVMQGGRVGGLRELQSLGVEALSPFEPRCSPDSAAGQQEQSRRTQEEMDDFFRKPPGKRNNYIKHGIPCPFGAPWPLLVQEWSQDSTTQDFYLLRDQKKLRELRDGTCTVSRDPRALLMISVRMENAGGLEEWSPVCLPHSESDLTIPPVEKNHVDESGQLRKDAREEHQAKLKSLQKERAREREKGQQPDGAEAMLLSKQHEAHMKSLWLPEPKELKKLSVRDLLGFVSQGSFSFSEGKAAGVGFITEPGYVALVQTKQWNPQLNVLVRKKTTMQYRVARLILL
ncbi:hypothetical protein B566_EDAN017095 [Ephemera danica]|nr:hypothetical protein B566_EDAN017095 [Ephemera danica]